MTDPLTQADLDQIRARASDTSADSQVWTDRDALLAEVDRLRTQEDEARVQSRLKAAEDEAARLRADVEQMRAHIDRIQGGSDAMTRRLNYPPLGIV